MQKSVFVAVALIGVSYIVGQNPAGKRDYVGPESLGPYRIDHDVPVRNITQALGQSAKARNQKSCYRSQDGTSFLWFAMTAHSPKMVGQVLLSSFSNCVDGPVQPTSGLLLSWKTEKGLGLGARCDRF